AKPRAERLIVELEKLGKGRIVALFPHAQFRFARDSREFVPWTDGEAVVAAEDAVAHRFAIRGRDMPFMLDGEVGDAGPRIELVGRDERIGRAHVEATAAGAAMIV